MFEGEEPEFYKTAAGCYQPREYSSQQDRQAILPSFILARGSMVFSPQYSQITDLNITFLKLLSIAFYRPPDNLYKAQEHHQAINVGIDLSDFCDKV